MFSLPNNVALYNSLIVKPETLKAIITKTRKDKIQTIYYAPKLKIEVILVM